MWDLVTSKLAMSDHHHHHYMTNCTDDDMFAPLEMDSTQMETLTAAAVADM